MYLRQIKVYWPLDDKFYPESISEYHENGGKHIIAYDDVPTENLNLKNETRRILDTNQISISNATSINDEALSVYFKTFTQKELTLHQAQGLTHTPFALAPAPSSTERLQ